MQRYVSNVQLSCVLLVCVPCRPPADKPYTEAHAYSAIPPASPASFRRQQQLQHMRQQRQQHNMEREERCLAGDAAAAAAAGGAKPKGTKAQNAQQQARLKHNQGVKASANVSDRRGWVCVESLLQGGRHTRTCFCEQQATCNQRHCSTFTVWCCCVLCCRLLWVCGQPTWRHTWSSCAPSLHPSRWLTALPGLTRVCCGQMIRVWVFESTTELNPNPSGLPGLQHPAMLFLKSLWQRC